MLGKLKSLLITDDGVETKPAAPAQAGTVVPPPVQRVILSAPPAQDDPKIVSALEEAIKAKTLDGYDYRKFLEAQRDLESTITDEPTRYRAVFGTIKQIGITKQKLIDTARHYVAVLESEEQAFLAGAEEQMKEKVGGNQKKVEELDQQISLKTAEIQRLTAEITALQATRADAAAQVTEWQTKIEGTKTSFKAVCDKMQAKIEQDIQKITSYLA